MKYSLLFICAMILCIKSITAQTVDFYILSDTVCFSVASTIQLKSNKAIAHTATLWDLNADGIFNDAQGDRITVVLPQSGANKVQAKIILPDNSQLFTNVAMVMLTDLPQAAIKVLNPCQTQYSTLLLLPKVSQSIVSQTWTIGAVQYPSDSLRYKFAEAGQHRVQVQIKNSQGCSNTIEEQITINELPNIRFTALEFVCLGDSAKFEAAVGIGTGSISHLLWIWGDSSLSISHQKLSHLFPAAKNYRVGLVAVSDAVCADTLYKTISVKLRPIVRISPLDTICYANSRIQLTAQGNFSSLQWANGSTSSSVEFTSRVDTTISVLAQSADACKSSASARIHTINAPQNMVFSKVISPNGDGINDTFCITDYNFWQPCVLNIFAENGVTIYSSVDYKNDWDGTFNGKQLPMGVYFFTLKAKDKEIKDVFSIIGN